MKQRRFWDFFQNHLLISIRIISTFKAFDVFWNKRVHGFFDDKNKIFIQVSATSKRRKIEYSLAKRYIKKIF
ncbi:MAG: hypothetical protein QG646_3744 [Euryarchaeota archaeon]|nr:hypothetical protein [Euryarchaeota archaeon]